MFALAAGVLVASLLGSLHCAGMCGGLVAFVAGGGGGARAQAAWHGGRLAAYAALGAASGALGAAIDLGGSVVGVKEAAATLAGGLMVAFGLVVLLRWRGLRLPAPPLPSALRSAFARAFAAVGEMPPVPRAALIGLLTALLPCGWLYAFVVTAAGTGDPLAGALAMTAFWAGTLPVLAALGAGVQRLAGSLGRHLPVAAALLLIGVGLYTVFGRLGLPDYTARTDPAGGLGGGAPCCAGENEHPGAHPGGGR
ncbi:MAG: sulfite exporter TauE/SafE family protein [Planctomycetota bacterium]|nr:MAG: sulfite exporter TauE/SafE family protein [Planctomycetota bacterium]